MGHIKPKICPADTADRQAYRQTDRQIDRQTGRQTDRQKDRQKHRQAGRKIDHLLRAKRLHFKAWHIEENHT